ncbi:MAG: polysaccharide deacetylase family protein [Deltaproteobacteria bacterium]|nr:polysaccharide deacetylase family protein [Deltaproteobacteria bacterium]
MDFPLILIYHRIAVDPINGQLLAVSPSNFESHLAELSERMRVLSLHDLVNEVRKNELRPNTVALTFDDGYVDNLTEALPLIEKYGLHATIFVTSGMVDSQGEFWWDAMERIFLEGHALPEDLNISCGRENYRWDLTTPEGRLKAYEELSLNLRSRPTREIDAFVNDLLTWAGLSQTGRLSHRTVSREQLRELADSPYIEIGSHTVSHPRLIALPVDYQRYEISQSKQDLETIIHRPVRFFSYPFGSTGDFTSETVQVVRDTGYEAGISNFQGNVLSAEPYAIPRRLVRDWDGETFSRWLKSKDKDTLENQTVSSRTGKLAAYISEFLPQKSHRNISLSGTERKLSIVHINTHDKAGGASKVASRLSEFQRNEQHRSHMVVGYKTTPSEHTMAFPIEVLRDVQTQCKRDGQLFYEFQGSHQLIHHPAIEGSDILHMHNLHGGYFNPFSLSALSLRKPVIWTLHDMQSITGHCAHSFDCEKWKTDCDGCPYLGTECALSVDTAAQLLRDKELIYSHSCLQIVTPSEWLKKKVEQSILKNHPVELIYNGVNTKAFHPCNKTDARRRFGIPEGNFAVGAVAHEGTFENPWKGGRYTWAALEGLWGKRDDLIFINIGADRRSTNPRIYNIPHIDGEEDLAQAYSALDLFLYTPVADNCPLVLLEALSCGLPVVTFDTGGVPELVRNGRDGFVVEFQDVAGLVRAVEVLISRPGLRDEFAVNAREVAVSTFDQDSMGRNYMKLYEKCIEDHSVRSQTIDLLPLEKVPEVVRTQVFVDASTSVSRLRQAKNPKRNAFQPEPILGRGRGMNSKEWEMPLDLEKDAPELFENGSISGEVKRPDAGRTISVKSDDSTQPNPIQPMSREAHSSAASHSRLGAFYFSEGNRDKAFEHFKEAVVLDPDNFVFQKDLADFYFSILGRTEAALEHYGRALSNNPKDINTLLTLGHISVSKKRFDEAKIFYNKVMEIDPHNRDAIEKVDLLRVAEKGDLQNETARRVTKRDGGNPALMSPNPDACSKHLRELLWFEWLMIDACNLNCGYCINNYGNPRGETSKIKCLGREVEMAEQILRLSNYAERVCVNLTGGEPTLCKGILEVISILSQAPNVYVQLITNLKLMDKLAKRFEPYLPSIHIVGSLHVSCRSDEELDRIIAFINEYKPVLNIRLSQVNHQMSKQDIDKLMRVKTETGLPISLQTYVPPKHECPDNSRQVPADAPIASTLGKRCCLGYSTFLLRPDGTFGYGLWCTNGKTADFVGLRPGDFEEYMLTEMLKCPQRSCGCNYNTFDHGSYLSACRRLGYSENEIFGPTNN